MKVPPLVLILLAAGGVFFAVRARSSAAADPAAAAAAPSAGRLAGAWRVATQDPGSPPVSAPVAAPTPPSSSSKRVPVDVSHGFRGRESGPLAQPGKRWGP